NHHHRSSGADSSSPPHGYSAGGATSASSPPRTPPGQAARAGLLSWAPDVRASYARQFVAAAHHVSGNAGAGGVKGSPARDLHVAVFDALLGPAHAKGGKTLRV